MNLKKIVAASLSVVTVVSASMSVSAELSQWQLECPDFSEIKSQKINMDYFNEALDKLNGIAENPDKYSDEDVLEYAEVLIDEFEFVSTLNSVCYIEFNKDVTNDELNDMLSETDVYYVEMNGDIGDCVTKLYDAGFEDVLRDVCGYDMINAFTYIDFEQDLSKYKDENERLLIEIDELINEYMSYTEDDFAVEYDGHTWVTSDLFDDPIYSEDELEEIAVQISEKRNETLGNIFLEILSKRHELAENSGYDNYGRYAYETSFMRDYTYDDTSEIYSVVKDKFDDLLSYTYDESSDVIYDSGLADRRFDKGEVLNTVGNYIAELSDDFSANFNHMRTHNLYCLEDSENGSGDSFSTGLFAYQVPYMYVSSDGSYNDLMTVVHEFGHANSEYTLPSSAVWDLYGTSLDTCEIHSQGLEVLFASENNMSLPDEEKEAYLKFTLNNMIHSIVQGCLFDEFQKYAYENPDCTLDDLNEEYARLCGEYGVDYSPENYYEYDWVEIVHNFDSPMYYISYATSAVSALDLWLTAMEDIDAAKETYIDFVENCDSYTSYLAATEYSSLANLFDKQALYEIAYQVDYYFDNGDIDPDYIPGSYDESDENTDDEDDSIKEYDDIGEFLDAVNQGKTGADIEDFEDKHVALILLTAFAPFIFFGIIYFIIAIIVIIVLVRNDKKKKQKNKNDVEPFDIE